MVETATRSEKVNQVMDLVKGLNVMDLVSLVKAMEEDFGVSATPAVGMMPMGAMGAGAGAAAEPKEEKTKFDVILKDGGPKKIQVIKEVRALTNLGLKEAKDLVDGAPKPVKEGVSKEEADKIKEKIEASGGVVEIK
jgi:large subunit ribosomal protein L7/L12